MQNLDKIDRLLAEVRSTVNTITGIDAVIQQAMTQKTKHECHRAEVLGRIAYLEGKTKGRNPMYGETKRHWNIGWREEQKADLTTDTIAA